MLRWKQPNGKQTNAKTTWPPSISWGVVGFFGLILVASIIEIGCTQQRTLTRQTPSSIRPPIHVLPPLLDDLGEHPPFLEAPPAALVPPALRPRLYDGPGAEQLPPQIRAWMPLQAWETALPVVSSPPLGGCRKRIVRMARRDRGRLWARCTSAAQNASYRSNCAGWLRCVFSRFGIDAFTSSGYRGSSGTFALFHFFQKYGYIHRGEPKQGDVVFWHATVDRNRNRNLEDDPLTHVGIVDGLDADGRVRILHTGYSPRPTVHEIFMYRAEPSLYKRMDGGKQRTFNSYLVSQLRKPSRRYSKRWRHTTGELFAGYGTLRVCPDQLPRE